MTDPATIEKIARIKQIDAMFRDASGWGSWMVTAANEREALVNQLNNEGHSLKHNYQARSSTGGRVD